MVRVPCRLRRCSSVFAPLSDRAARTEHTPHARATDYYYYISHGEGLAAGGICFRSHACSSVNDLSAHHPVFSFIAKVIRTWTASGAHPSLLPLLQLLTLVRESRCHLAVRVAGSACVLLDGGLNQITRWPLEPSPPNHNTESLTIAAPDNRWYHIFGKEGIKGTRHVCRYWLQA